MIIVHPIPADSQVVFTHGLTFFSPAYLIQIKVKGNCFLITEEVDLFLPSFHLKLFIFSTIIYEQAKRRQKISVRKKFFRKIRATGNILYSGKIIISLFLRAPESSHLHLTLLLHTKYFR